MAVPREHGRGGLVAPAGEARVAVGRVADERQAVRDALGCDAPLRPHAGVVVGEVAAAIPEHDPLVTDQLGHVLVRGADHDPLDPRVRGESVGGGADRVVGLELDHRPQDHVEGLDRGLGDRELVQQLRRHPGRRLVALVQVVAERLDDPVRGAADVRRALLAEQVQQLLDEPAHARQEDPLAAEHGRSRRVMGAEQLVGGVDEVEVHGRWSAGSALAAAGHDRARVAQLLERGLAVALAQVHGGDGVGRARWSRSPGAARRGRSP